MRYLKNPLPLLLPVLLALLLTTTTARAQNLIGFSPNVVSGWPDTIQVGNSATVATYVKNYSTTFTFYDVLMLEGSVDTGSGPVPFSFPYPTQDTISALDSIFIAFSFLFDTAVVGAPQFHVGNNVVVVWPIGVGPGGWQPKDSIIMNVFVIDTMSGIPEPPQEFVRIWPVPANGPLYITSVDGQYEFTYVIIRDALGQTVYSGVPNGNAISTDAWSRGLYTVEAALSNGTVSWFKIMRQ